MAKLLQKTSLFTLPVILLFCAYGLQGCGGGGDGSAPGGQTDPATYSVVYNGNGNTNGTAPVDSNQYQQDQTVTVLGQGSLSNGTCAFGGWNTQPDGKGTTYQPNQQFQMGSSNITLYAVWNPTYTVTYNANGATGAVPMDPNQYQQGQMVTVLGPGSLSSGGETFAGWNTQSDGKGAPYQPGQQFPMGPSNITLYAIWTVNTTYTVFYNGNNNTGGSPPSDPTNYQQGQTVTVPGNTGNLTKTGYSFTGWNTAPDGSGATYAQGQTFTMGASNVTLYALWTSTATYTVTYNGNGNTGGTVPVDSTNYLQGQTVTVQGNTGNLVKTGYVFAGWNTQSDGNGTTFWQGQTFTMGANNVTLYARWASSIAEYAYVANYKDNTLSQYTITSDGGLSPLTPATVMAGDHPTSITVDPSGSYAYATNAADNSVSQYTINSDGTLAPMSTPAVSTGAWPAAITVDPSDRYVYVANSRDNCYPDTTCGTISQYTIGSGGALTPMYPKTIYAIASPQSVAVAPSGMYAYAANEGDSTLSQYTIGSGGALATMNPVWVHDIGDGPQSIVINPSGTYLYTADLGSNTVTQWAIGSNGALTAVTTFATGSSPLAITIDPSGSYAYVANAGDGAISQYTIGSGGALIAMDPATVPAGTTPQSITVDPSGTYVYVANSGDGTISQYKIGSGGALTPLSAATVPAGTHPQSIVTAR